MQESVKTGSGESTRTASSASAKQGALESRRDELEWNARYNSAVCDEYAGFYSLCDKASTFVVAVFGTYTFVTFFVGMNRVYAAISIAVSFISVASLIFRFSDKCASEIARRALYDSLITEINQAKNVSQLDGIERRLVDASSGEPKRLEIVRAVAYNEAAGQMGCDEKYNVEIGWFKMLTRFIIPWKRPSYKVLQNVD